jgi:urease accessory protein
MIRATRVFPASRWSQVATDVVVLDYDNRHRRRIKMQGEGGLIFLLDLPEAAALADGDGLLLEDGRIVAVRAAPEELVEIAAGDAGALMRIAWHLGNRHLPVQILGDRIRIHRDAVIEEMLRGLGASLTPVSAPFDAEGGAYGHSHADGGHADAHGDDHHHDHGHD